MRERLKQQEVLKKAKEIHGDKYDYSKLKYKTYHEKFIVVCPEHGEFEKDYVHFIKRKQGCPQCAKNLKNVLLEQKILVEEFQGKNLQKEYEKLINNAKKRMLVEKYYEKHHIKPKSLGGSDEKDNLVSLTPEEHFKAHYLLWKITKTKEMQDAFWLMVIMSKNGDKKITPEEYEILRLKPKFVKKEREKKEGNKRKVYCLELDKEFNSLVEATVYTTGRKKHSNYISSVCNKNTSACFEWKNGRRYHWCWLEEKEELIKNKERLIYEEEHRLEITGKKISEAKKGKTYPNRKGICYLTEESKKKISEKNKGKTSAFKGKHHSEDTKKKISSIRKGKVSAFKGKHHSEDTKKKISEKRGIPVICVEKNKIYKSCKDALLDLQTTNKTNSTAIKKAAENGKIAYGYHWKFS